MSRRRDRADLYAFEAVARRARSDGPTALDVTAAVAARIALPVATVPDRTLLACAVGALLTAVVVTLLSAGVWSELADPLPALLDGFELALR